MIDQFMFSVVLREITQCDSAPGIGLVDGEVQSLNFSPSNASFRKILSKADRNLALDPLAIRLWSSSIKQHPRFAGNDLTNIAQLAPGAVMNTDNNFGAAFSILGMPGVSYLHTIDGMNTTDTAGYVQQVGSLFLTLGQNLVQEATVVTTGYSGQFGGAAGGNINYVTKSGTNQFHGNAQYWWNGRVLNANMWFDKANGLPRPFDIANQWAGSMGGPIQKGKLFFFADNEGLRVTVPQTFFDIHAPSPQFEDATLKNIENDSRFGLNSATYSFYRNMFGLYDAASSAHPTAPGAVGDPVGCGNFQDPHDPNGPGHNGVPCTVHFSGVRGRPSQDILTSGRLDWNVSDHDRAFLRVQYDGGRSAIFLAAIDPVFDADASLPWWQGLILETHTFGSSGANQFLLAGSSGLASYIKRRKGPADAPDRLLETKRLTCYVPQHDSESDRS